MSGEENGAGVTLSTPTRRASFLKVGKKGVPEGELGGGEAVQNRPY